MRHAVAGVRSCHERLKADNIEETDELFGELDGHAILPCAIRWSVLKIFLFQFRVVNALLCVLSQSIVEFVRSRKSRQRLENFLAFFLHLDITRHRFSWGAAANSA